MRIAGVVFDKDGTLFDFERTFAPACAGVVRQLAGGDAALAMAMAQAVGFDLAVELFARDSVVIAGTAVDLAAAWAPLLDLPADADAVGLAGRIDALFREQTAATAVLFDGVAATLAALSGAGFKLGLATNDAEANGRAHARAAGIDRYIDFYAGYDSGYGAKPGPGMVSAFAAYCQVPPHRVAMVGDSLHDLHAARNAGAIAVAVTTGMAGADKLAPHADHVVTALADTLRLPFIGLAAGIDLAAGPPTLLQVDGDDALPPSNASIPSTPA